MRRAARDESALPARRPACGDRSWLTSRPAAGSVARKEKARSAGTGRDPAGLAAFHDNPAAGSATWSRLDSHLVELDRDHPGFRDLTYRTRRDAIARLADAHQRGEPPPHVAYTAEEEQVWAAALDALAPLHARYACRGYITAWPGVGLVPARIPQLAEISDVLTRATGFGYAPVAGLVTPRDFMDRLGGRTFLATQYMRHPSTPLYTPEPDLIHELVGHAPSLCDERYARINELFGRATRVADDTSIDRLIRTYWYCMEFGVVREGDTLKAVGAGLLSSFGELGRFERDAKLVPFDLEVVGRTPFDPTQYQSTLFVAASEDALLSTLTEWLEIESRG